MTNISQIMKQAKVMQEKMAEVQKKVEFVDYSSCGLIGRID